MYHNTNGIYNSYKNSILKIVAYDKNGDSKSHGTAVIIKSIRAIVTNYHNVFLSSYFKLFNDEHEIKHNGIIAMNPDKDILLLGLDDADNYPDIELCTQVNVEEDIFTLGYQSEDSISTTRGIVSGIDQIITLNNSMIGAYRNNLIQIDASISPGSSGGGLFNADGQLIGITTLTNESGQNLNYAITIKEVLELYKNSQDGYIINASFRENIMRFHLALINNDLENALIYINKCLKFCQHEYFLYDKIAILISLGKYIEAISLCDKSLEKKIDFQVLSYKLTALNLIGGREKEAFDIIFNNYKGNDFTSYLMRGYVYLLVGNLVKAHQCINKALSLNRNSKMAQILLAQIYQKKGNIKHAIQIINKLCDNFPEDYYPFVMLSEVYHSIDDNTNALEYINKAIEKRNVSKDLNLDLTKRTYYTDSYPLLNLFHKKISCLIDLKQTDEAFCELNLVYKTQLKDFDYYFFHSLILLNMGMVKESLSQACIAKKLKSNDYGINNLLCKIYIEMNEYEKGLKSINKALSIIPDMNEGLLIKATILFVIDRQVSEAVIICENILKHNNKNIQALELLMFYYSSINQPKQMLIYGKKLITLKPKEHKYLMSVAEAYDELEKRSESTLYYSKSIEMAPNLESYLGRSKNYFLGNKIDLALKDLKEAEKLNPHESRIYFLRGCINRQLRLYSQAIEDFNKVIILNPDFKSQLYPEIKSLEDSIKNK